MRKQLLSHKTETVTHARRTLRPSGEETGFSTTTIIRINKITQ